MDLRVIWFILVAVLFMGFFFLEGFDFGVGVLLPFVGKKDVEKRIVMNTIGPFWDGNEVWLITAGGAIFAAFPNLYATMFSGFYLALLVVLVALIVRGVTFEFRSKRESETWRRTWDTALFVSSLLLAVLWGVALANLIKGVPVDSKMNYTGGFFDLLSVYTLLAGITSLLVFTYHGSVFLSLRLEGELKKRAEGYAEKLGYASIAAAVLLAAASFFYTDLYKSILAIVFVVISLCALVVSRIMVQSRRTGYAMALNGVSIATGVGALFAGLFPNLMVSSITKAYSLTIYNASSSSHTLRIMTIVAFTLVPIVLAYQIWTYYIFRKRVTQKDIEY